MKMIDSGKIKKEFPIFAEVPKLTYLDSGASSLKPQAVIDKQMEYYSRYSANIFRGVYRISERATEEYEKTRNVVAAFINSSPEEIIFTRNTTESLNLVAYTLGRQILEKGDEVITTIMEHHANFVPWQQLVFENGLVLKIIDIDDEGNLVTGKTFAEIITKKTKILALTFTSNVLGTINPVKKLIAQARKIKKDIIVIIDGAQAVPHQKIDVVDLDCDFLAFSSHKMLGPTGVGVLYGRMSLLEKMPPFLLGGDMIEEVHVNHTVFKKPPHKFEAGTPAIGEVIAFKEAIKYLEKIGMDKIKEHEKKISFQCFKTLKSEFGDQIKIFGPENFEERGGAIAFSFGKYHPHDIASILDTEGICVRAGNHCAMPLHERIGVEATVRASFYIYNDEEDIERLIKGLKKAYKILKKKI